CFGRLRLQSMSLQGHLRRLGLRTNTLLGSFPLQSVAQDSTTARHPSYAILGRHRLSLQGQLRRLGLRAHAHIFPFQAVAQDSTTAHHTYDGLLVSKDLTRP